MNGHTPGESHVSPGWLTIAYQHDDTDQLHSRPAGCRFGAVATMNRRVRRAPRMLRMRVTDRVSATNDAVLSRQINEVELALRREDPAFVKRFRRVQRADTVRVLVTFALLAVGAVLMTLGLATASVVALPSGLVTMLAACLVDQRHRRPFRRSPRAADAPSADGEH